MNKGGSDSESDSDSDISEKEIVVRQLPLRHVVRASPEHRPDSRTPDPEPAPAPVTAPPIPTNNTMDTTSQISLNNPGQMTRSTSYDDDENVYTPGSARSIFSVREEDIVVIMRSIPEYGQYTDAKGLDNDRYLRSALFNISEELLDYQDENGNTLLLIACQYSCEELVRILLKQGADARITNTSGANGLHFACYRDSLSIPIVELLLANDAQVNVAENLYGCTPLHYAAGTGNLALCELLIRHGAYIHAHDFDNCTSIDYAKDAGMFEVADYLANELNATYGTAKNTNKGAKHAEPQDTAATTPVRSRNATDNIMQIKASPMTDMSRFSNSKATPAPTPQRFVLNENSPSYDEEDHINMRNNRDAHVSDTRTQRTVYDFIEPAGEQHSGGLPPTDHHHHHTSNTYNTNNTSTVFRAAKGSPGSTGSVSSSAQSSPGNAASNNNTATAAQPAQPAHTIKKGHQPTSASPYKPLSPSPVNASSTKSGAAKGFFIATDDLHDASGYNSGPNTITSSHTYSSHPVSQPSSHSSSSGAHSRYSDSKHSEIPPLPTPTYNSPDGHYSEVDNCTDLSPDKFELYIERAKFNAKIAKERALNKDILGAKEGQIRTLLAEVSALKRTVVSYKEEVHALNAKLDLMQLPFIETTNALQEELHALRKENKQLKDQLSGKH